MMQDVQIITRIDAFLMMDLAHLTGSLAVCQFSFTTVPCNFPPKILPDVLGRWPCEGHWPWQEKAVSRVRKSNTPTVECKT